MRELLIKPECASSVNVVFSLSWIEANPVPIGNSYPFAIATDLIPYADFKHKYYSSSSVFLTYGFGTFSSISSLS